MEGEGAVHMVTPRLGFGILKKTIVAAIQADVNGFGGYGQGGRVLV
jgi:hypothetical protein